MTKKRVLVTGAAGYVGSILCRQLLEAGHEVVGIDKLLFGGQPLWPLMGMPKFRFYRGDICDAAWMRPLIVGVDSVVHLAAIVGDPACKKFPDDATATMDVASKQLYQACKEVNVGHFVFASTCSNYGIMDGNQLLTEDSLLHPQSHYAILKVEFEKFLLQQGKELPCTILRFATAFGHSYRPRFDLTVNHFTRDMCLGRQLDVFAANLWRPYCHVEDLARAAALCVNQGSSGSRCAVYNVGDSNMNFTKREIVEAIRPFATEAKVDFPNSMGADLRNYRVDFNRFAEATGFVVTKTLEDGIRESAQFVRSGLVDDPFDPRFQNA